jgi:hypothetical protein
MFKILFLVILSVLCLHLKLPGFSFELRHIISLQPDLMQNVAASRSKYHTSDTISKLLLPLILHLVSILLRALLTRSRIIARPISGACFWVGGGIFSF